MTEGDTPPVSEGDEVDVTIEAVGDKGDGIAKVDGFVLFVGGTQKGDEVKVKVNKVLENMGFAEKIGEADNKKKKTKEQPKESIQVDENTGREKIKGETFEAEYDPSKESESFGE